LKLKSESLSPNEYNILQDEMEKFSLISRLTPSLIISLFFVMKNFEIIPPIVTLMNELLTLLSDVSGPSENVYDSDKRYLDISSSTLPNQNYRFVGTQHPFRGLSPQKKTVEVEGFFFFHSNINSNQ